MIESLLQGNPWSLLMTIVLALIILLIVLKIAKPLIGIAVLIVGTMVGLMFLEYALLELGYADLANTVGILTGVIHLVFELFIDLLEAASDLLGDNSPGNSP